MAGSLTIFQVASHGSLERGGAVQMFRLARGLAERGHRLLCILNAQNGAGEALQSARRRLEAAGLETDVFAMNRWGGMRRFRMLVKARRPDVIHVHREAALRFVWLATAGMRLPCLVTNRGTVYAPKAKTLERFLIRSRKLHRVLAVSHAVREAVLRQVALPPGKVEVVYGGVYAEEFDIERINTPVRDQYNVHDNQPLIAHCGALVAKKGVPILLDAFRLLLREKPLARLLLIGGGKLGRAREELKQRGLEDKAFLAGPQEDVAPFMAAADVVAIAATRGEGLTGSLREALALSRPVVCTDVAGNGEMIRHMETGLLVPPHDPQALAAALAWMIDHPAEAAAMARAGRAWVLEHCEERVRSARVEQIYRDVLDGSLPRPRT